MLFCDFWNYWNFRILKSESGPKEPLAGDTRYKVVGPISMDARDAAEEPWSLILEGGVPPYYAVDTIRPGLSMFDYAQSRSY